MKTTRGELLKTVDAAALAKVGGGFGGESYNVGDTKAMLQSVLSQ